MGPLNRLDYVWVSDLFGKDIHDIVRRAIQITCHNEFSTCLKSLNILLSCTSRNTESFPHFLRRVGTLGRGTLLYILPSSGLSSRSFRFQDVPCDEERDGSHEYGIITTPPYGHTKDRGTGVSLLLHSRWRCQYAHFFLCLLPTLVSYSFFIGRCSDIDLKPKQTPVRPNSVECIF